MGASTQRRRQVEFSAAPTAALNRSNDRKVCCCFSSANVGSPPPPRGHPPAPSSLCSSRIFQALSSSLRRSRAAFVRVSVFARRNNKTQTPRREQTPGSRPVLTRVSLQEPAHEGDANSTEATELDLKIKRSLSV